MLKILRPRMAALAVAAALAASVPWPVFAAAETFVIDKAHSEASFQVRHFVTRVRGRFTDFGGTITLDRARPEASAVEMTIQTVSIDTDVEKRDQHLRSADFFEVDKYPQITFRSSKVVPRGGDRYDVTGTFAMHGVSKELTVPVSFLGFVGSGPQEKAGFSAEFTLNRKDFGIVWNRALDTGGTVLGDDVFITVNIEAGPPQPSAPPAPPATK